MEKKLTFAIMLALAMLLVVTPVLAGGDKNRGTVGTGDVEQHQVSWDEYESQRLIQEQVLTQTQVQIMAQVRERLLVQWQNGRLADLWF